MAAPGFPVGREEEETAVADEAPGLEAVKNVALRCFLASRSCLRASFRLGLWCFRLADTPSVTTQEDNDVRGIVDRGYQYEF